VRGTQIENVKARFTLKILLTAPRFQGTFLL
jgi:hypothetical protein